MELVGKFKKQLEIVERKDFKSRKVWIVTEDNPQYPQTVELETQQDKVTLFDNVAEGAPVKCYINLRGREWTNKENVVVIFNSLVCWKVEALPRGAKVAESKAPIEEDTSGLPF